MTTERDLLDPETTSSTPPRRVSLYTLGCKLNYAETMTLQRSFVKDGYNVVDFKDRTDVVLINTCSVTENADREARKIVRQALRRSPEAFVIVVGCYAQLRPETIASIEGVDLVLGAKEKFRVSDFIKEPKKFAHPKIFISEISEVKDFVPAFSFEHGDRTRAFLKVQDGCDYTCSFCTIPLARGASRSNPVIATVENAKELLAQGFREIVLSGVNVGDYGKKINTNLLELLGSLVELEGEFRIRISSIEPNLLVDEIIELTRVSPKMCRHFHIPLQSGSDEVLKGMRRRYNSRQYRERVQAILTAIPDCAIGIDVIVGFPGETEANFLETYNFLVDLPCAYLHVFSYSERPDTAALSITGSVPHTERARRSKMLRILSEKKRAAFYASQKGSTRNVLFESQEGEHCTGFTDNYVRVGVKAPGGLENELRQVRLESVEGEFVFGSLINYGK